MTLGAESLRLNVTAIVIPLVGGNALAECIAGVHKLTLRCIVVGPAAYRVTANNAGAAEFIESDEPVPVRRLLGARRASTEWLVLLEDSCKLADTWGVGLAQLNEFAQVDAAAGPIHLATSLPPRFIALGCVEYGEFAVGRHTGGLTQRLPGLCIVYRCSAIGRGVADTELIEPEIQSRIIEQHRQMQLFAALAVTYDALDARAARCGMRFTHGRIFGGWLRRRASLARCAKSVLGAPLLPFLLARRARRGLPANYGAPWRARAHIFFFACAWTLGELIGVIVGPGRSVEAWR